MRTTQRFPWVAVSTVVAIVVVGAVAWLQPPSDAPNPAATANRPSLGLARIAPALSGELLAEQLAAYDPTPMFMPSAMNSSDPALPEGVKPGARGPFAIIEPEFTKTAPLIFPPTVKVSVGSFEGLRLTERAGSPLAMGRLDSEGGGLENRAGRLEAVAASGGNVLLTLDIPSMPVPPEADWQPLELLGAVSRTGLVGELVVTSSSGFSEVDDFFRYQLKRNLRIGERLPEGFYAFRVGP
jgi:hypothetical protein